MIGIPMKRNTMSNGEKTVPEKLYFYDGLDENLIKEKYPQSTIKSFWQMKLCSTTRGKEAGKVYAISTHPNIKKEELSEKKFVLN